LGSGVRLEPVKQQATDHTNEIMREHFNKGSKRILSLSSSDLPEQLDDLRSFQEKYS
jgi:hypothetical protein